MKEENNQKNLKTSLTFDEFVNLKMEEYKILCTNVINKFFSKNLYEIQLFIYIKSKYSFNVITYKPLEYFETIYDIIIKKYPESKIESPPSSFSIFKLEKEIMSEISDFFESILYEARTDELKKFIYLKFIYDIFFKENDKLIKINTPIKPEILKQVFHNNNINKQKEQNKLIGSMELIKNKFMDKFDNDNSISDDKSIKNRKLAGNYQKNNINYVWKNIGIIENDKFLFTGNIRIKGQCLFIHRENKVFENEFEIQLILYKIKYIIYRKYFKNNGNETYQYINPNEIYEIYNHPYLLADNTLGSINHKIVITLKHAYDLSSISLIFDNDINFIDLKNFIEIIDYNKEILQEKSPFIIGLDEKYINTYGKLLLNLVEIKSANPLSNSYLKITFLPYCFYSKRININSNDTFIFEKINFNINQKLYLPLHNRFGEIKFELFQEQYKGVIVKTKIPVCIFEKTIEVTSFLNQFQSINQILCIDLKKVNDEEKSDSKGPSPNRKDILENKCNDCSLYIKLIDYSHPINFLLKNRNKNIFEANIAGDDNVSIKILFKRFKKTMYMLEKLNEKYQNIFRFKYPILSIIILIIIIVSLLTIESKYIFSLVILIPIFIMIFNTSLFNNNIKIYANKYIFKYKNPYDQSSNFIKTKKELDEKEIQNQTYIIDKDEININDIIDPLKNISKYLSKYDKYILKTTKWVSTIEKIKNLFTWTDPKLSAYFLILIFICFLVIFKIDFKYMFLLSFIKKFIIGFFYYRNKYFNNIEIGRITLESCAYKWREKCQSSNKDNLELVKNEIDFKSFRLYNEEFKLMIKEIFELNTNIIINEELLNKAETLQDIQNELIKCESIIKIKKSSYLYIYTQNNKKIFEIAPEIEDIFFYFLQNIKSDYYILQHNIYENNNQKENENIPATQITTDTPEKNKDNKYTSYSSEGLIKKDIISASEESNIIVNKVVVGNPKVGEVFHNLKNKKLKMD